MSENTRNSRRRPTMEPQVHYTALIRLPFSRGDFVDPAPVDWDTSKDRVLWKMISRSPKTTDLNWDELATEFQVPPAFMLQQAAWLYNRHLSHVRAQMRKAGTPSSLAGVTGSGITNAVAGGVPMNRLGSGGASKGQYILPTQSRILKDEGNTFVAPKAIARPLSRTLSTNTLTQTRHPPPAIPRQLCNYLRSPSASESSSSESSEELDSDKDVRRSQIFVRRQPRFKRHKSLLGVVDSKNKGLQDSEDENGELISFLPFAVPRSQEAFQDSNVEVMPRAGQREPCMGQEPCPSSGKKMAIESSASSVSSVEPQSDTSRSQQRLSVLRAEMLRPRGSARREGSEGTPSMGSSFSDLDDASVTQSALEEAWLSNMQQHGSRISNFGAAIKSRYL